MRRSLAKLFRREVIADNHAALHDELDGFENVHVGSGITTDGDEVGIVAVSRAPILSASQEIGGIDRCGLDGIERLHGPSIILSKLFCIISVRVNAGVRAESHLCAGFEKHGGNFHAAGGRFSFSFSIDSGASPLLRLPGECSRRCKCRRRDRCVLLGEGDAFVIDQTGMFDRIDARADSVFDGLRAVRVRSNFAASLCASSAMACISFQCVLRRSGLIGLC